MYSGSRKKPKIPPYDCGVKWNVVRRPSGMVNVTLCAGSASRRGLAIASVQPLPKSPTMSRSKLSYVLPMTMGSPVTGMVKSVMVKRTRPGLNSPVTVIITPLFI